MRLPSSWRKAPDWLDAGPLGGLVHVNQRAAARDVVEFGGVDARVAGGVVDGFHPDADHDEADGAGDVENPGPAEADSDPAGERREEKGGEVLAGIEDGGGRAAFGGGEPGGDDAGVAGEAGSFGEAEQESHGEEEQSARRRRGTSRRSPA